MNDDRPVIAQVLHRLYLAGAEVLSADLARNLGDRFRFVFICLDEIGLLGDQLIAEGFEVLNLKRHPGIDWSVARCMGDLVRSQKIDILHAHQYTPFFYAAAGRRLMRTPILFTEHGRHYPDQRKIQRVLANKLLLHRCDRVISVGRFVKQSLVDYEGFPARRIETIYNGVDIDRFDWKGNQKLRGAARQALELPSDHQVVLLVARFHPVKDHQLAIRAFARVVSKNRRAILLLVGDGDGREAIENLVQALGINDNVRFLGLQSDIPQIMAAADVFMLSSLSEGISVTLLEAMASGLPVAATNVGGNGEVVMEGKTGLLSPRGNSEILSRNLMALLGNVNMRMSMGQAAQQRVRKCFTQEQMHSRYASLYQEMLENHVTG